MVGARGENCLGGKRAELISSAGQIDIQAIAGIGVEVPAANQVHRSLADIVVGKSKIIELGHATVFGAKAEIGGPRLGSGNGSQRERCNGQHGSLNHIRNSKPNLIPNSIQTTQSSYRAK